MQCAIHLYLCQYLAQALELFKGLPALSRKDIPYLRASAGKFKILNLKTQREGNRQKVSVTFDKQDL